MPVKFGTPPSRRGGAARAWGDEAAELRERPGEWALLETKATATAASMLAFAIRTGHLVAFRPQGAYEATVRGMDVWVRYIGGAE